MGLRPGVAAYHKDDKKLSELHARISQETFDEVVQENVEDLDMGPDEALADAIAQFETQGVNLDNIVKRPPGAEYSNDPACVIALREIKGALEEAQMADDAEEEVLEIEYGGGLMRVTFVKIEAEAAVVLTTSAASLRNACQSDKPSMKLILLTGAVDALVSTALAVMNTASALPPVLEALAIVLSDAEGREQLGVRGIAAIVALMRQHASNPAVMRAGMHAARSAMLIHEQHRQQFVTSGKLLRLVVGVLKTWPDEVPTFLAACGALRLTTMSDDLRSRTSKGLEHAKSAVEGRVLPMLLTAARSPLFAGSPAALAELMATISRLTVTDQICSQLAGMDALELAITELGNHMTDAGVAKQACFFLASISGNDQCKGSIVAGHGHVAIIQAMLLHPNNASMQTDAVSALGNMCLRMPGNCEAIAEADGLPAIVQAFTQHIGFARMQSKGPLAVRNLVGRNEELIKPLLALGAEAPLREVLAAHEDGYVHNLAKAALRELHCTVQLKEVFQGTLEDAHILDSGGVDDENHWDKFLETPVAQQAIKDEMQALGIEPGRAEDHM